MDKIGWITETGVLLFVAACLSACRGGTSSDRQSVWKCRLLEVEGGYGYVILHGHDTVFAVALHVEDLIERADLQQGLPCLHVRSEIACLLIVADIHVPHRNLPHVERLER